jgi:hypothetical protein
VEIQKACVNDSTVYETRMVNMGRKFRKNNPKIKKPHCIVLYKILMKRLIIASVITHF